MKKGVKKNSKSNVVVGAKSWRAPALILFVAVAVGLIVFGNIGTGVRKDSGYGELGSGALDFVDEVVGTEVFDEGLSPDGDGDYDDEPVDGGNFIDFIKEEKDKGDDPQNPGCAYTYKKDDKKCMGRPIGLAVDRCSGAFSTFPDELVESIITTECKSYNLLKEGTWKKYLCKDVCEKNPIKKKSNGCKIKEKVCNFRGEKHASAYCECV